MKEITQQQILDAGYKHAEQDSEMRHYSIMRNAFIDGAKWVIEQMQPEWIPLKEKYPEHYQTVMLCNVEEKEQTLGHFNRNHNEFQEVGDRDEIGMGWKPTHWCIFELPYPKS